jgi:hypothetical protein
MKEKRLELQGHSLVVKKKKGVTKKIEFKLSTPEAFILNLQLIREHYALKTIEEVELSTNEPGGGEKLKSNISKVTTKALSFFRKYLDDISYRNNEVKLKLQNIPPGEEEAIKKEADSIINNDFIYNVIKYFFEEEEKKKFRQPIPYLREGSKLIGNNTLMPSLFSSNAIFLEDSGIARDKMSKNTHALGVYFFMKFQNGERSIKLDNLSQLAEKMRVTNNEVKKYILYLGEKYNVEKIIGDELTIERKSFFDTSFTYSSEDTLKIQKGIIKKVGSNNHFYAYDCREKSITITPTQKLLEAINPEQKKGSKTGGFIYTAEEFLDLMLDLETDIAYKILCHTASNSPNGKIGEDKLIKALGLTEQTKKQGRPRIRQTILKGFEELKSKGHIIKYNYNPGEDMYSYSYSNKYIDHSYTHKKKGVT